MEPRQRLAALEAWLDPGTIRLLEVLGVGDGWRCLDVGAGGGSIAAWLCRRVGVAGHVLATDLDTRFLEAIDAPSLEVRRHDVTTDALPDRAFDLVHARAVLEHLPRSARERALDRMVAALKPGGWLLAESGDYISWTPLPGVPAQSAALFARASAAIFGLQLIDEFYGRRLPDDLQAHGVVEV